MSRAATTKPPFDLQEWARGMDIVLGTKVEDPLIRWSQRNDAAPVTGCRFCGTAFTTLGLPRHEKVCPEADHKRGAAGRRAANRAKLRRVK